MKLNELEITNLRGIRHLVLAPEGNNVVIWGPNGTGKSAIVDALDFLLTGSISRLSGTGTQGITLKEHGPHIDAAKSPKTVSVKGKFKLTKSPDAIEVSRSLAHPKILAKPTVEDSELETALVVAQRGQWILTRREILKFIAAQGGDRASQIQGLLNLGQIEKIRSTLVKLRNDANQHVSAANTSSNAAEAVAAATLKIPFFSVESAVGAVNDLRKVLGGGPITELKSGNIKRDLGRPAITATPVKEILTLRQSVEQILSLPLAAASEKLNAADADLRKLAAEIRTIPALARAIKRKNLTELGLALLDDSGACPLCDTPWPPGELHANLRQRLAAITEGEELARRASELSSIIDGQVGVADKLLDETLRLRGRWTSQCECGSLEKWWANLKALASALASPVDKYPDQRFPSEMVSTLLCTKGALTELSAILAAAKELCPDASNEEMAWDTLTKFEENLKRLETAKQDEERLRLASARCDALHQAFEEARDSVLGDLYNRVKNRFVQFYAFLHEDEKTFSATLAPDGPAVNFAVDFYGRGEHPPLALHSEGHQDSMGICLYLAMMEMLRTEGFDIIALDDVVMSVDTGHRRRLCKLLKEFFPAVQFIITTHDKTWAYELKAEGVVTSRCVYDFYNWSIETGPQCMTGREVWEAIRSDLNRNDVSSAAAKVRRAGEQFFWSACNDLEAKVTFKASGRYELGDLMPPSVARLGQLLKKAQTSAKSWGDSALGDRIEEAGSILTQVYTRTQAEQWAVNANVHYNSWATMEAKEFFPVAEAVFDLFHAMSCNSCGNPIAVVKRDSESVALKCPCNAVNWNLEEKPKDHK